MDSARKDIQADLRELAFTMGWPDVVIDQIAPLAERIVCPAGAVIFRSGEINEKIYLIQSGHVALEMPVPARGRVRLLTLARGELLGWSPLLGNREMTATAMALEETRLLTISGTALQALCRANCEIGFVVMEHVAEALSRRLVATRLQLLDLFSRSPPEVAAASTGGPPR